MICDIYDKWDIVVVPFPFADIPKSKPRPALVISNKKFNSKNSHTTLMMITSSVTYKWFSDVEILDLAKTGLPKTSFLRMKVFTLDNRLIKKKIGTLALKDKKRAELLIKESL